MNAEIVQRVLIYRLGSLGDTVVALPALRLVARVFPDAQRYALTNFSVNDKAAPMAHVLDGTGLIHGYLEYPIGVRDLGAVWALARRIRQLRPDVLVYLAAPRGRLKAWRDAVFFKFCGIRRIVGVPFAADSQKPLKLDNQRYEYEGARLIRCIRALGNARLDDPGAFDLSLTGAEHLAAQRVMDTLGGHGPLLAISIGAKDDVKDWGDTNWLQLIDQLGIRLPGWSLVMIGAGIERDRSAKLMHHWAGDALNLCGTLTVRDSAALLSRARVYCGHDSGPTHLAAAVGTPCVAIFSSRNFPGEWFPYGSQHRVIYHSVVCQGCRLAICVERDKACIRSISVDEVVDAVMQTVEGSALQMSLAKPNKYTESGADISLHPASPFQQGN